MQYAHPTPGQAVIPTRAEAWLKPKTRVHIEPGFYADEASREAVDEYAKRLPWTWTSESLFFLSDVHADAEAFVRSLELSGGVRRTGDGDTDIELTAQGQGSTFLIGGDCLDKGPSNLRLLRSLKALIDAGGNVRLLAGNHDLRALVGMSCLGEETPLLAHLFVRMGIKIVPLFRELASEYLTTRSVTSSIAEETKRYQEIFPTERWYREFPKAARGLIPAKKIELELIRIREKSRELEAAFAKANLTLSQVSFLAKKFHEQFLTPRGELYWFFERMELVARRGSLLFVHAGVDDDLASQLRVQGVESLNQKFHGLVARDEWFELYHGPIGNAFRTKYRDTDLPLSQQGVADLHASGIYAIVHGHRNIKHGQRMIFRNGMLNFECDASIDRNTRVLEGLPGLGGAVTVFRPDGVVMGMSSDHPNIKVFDPAEHCQVVSLI